MIAVAVAGAITALGDTLFPASSLAQGVADDFAATANFLIRLRIVHPMLAVLAGVFLATLAAPEYRWEAGEQSGTFGGLPITYLIGYPRERSLPGN